MKTCTLIDVTIPTDRNVAQRKEEKKLKYKSLCIQGIWNLECKIIPITNGATGMLVKYLRKNLEAIPGKHSIDLLQKTAILGTSHIIRKVGYCNMILEA
jgi:hypothetical protein